MWGCAAVSPPKWSRGVLPGPEQGVFAAGVGVGQDLEWARKQAMVELFKEFRGRGERVGSLEAAGKVVETWYDRNLNAHYALAVIENKDAESMLSQKIDEADRQISFALYEASTTPWPVRQWGAYLRAAQAIPRRNELTAQLTALSPSATEGRVPQQRSMVLRQAGSSAARVGMEIHIANDWEGLVKKELVRALAGYGVRLVPAFAANFQLTGTVVVDTRVDDLGFPWYLVSCQIKAKTAEGYSLEVPPARVGRKLMAGLEAEREARRELGIMLADRILEQVAGGTR